MLTRRRCLHCAAGLFAAEPPAPADPALIAGNGLVARAWELWKMRVQPAR